MFGIPNVIDLATSLLLSLSSSSSSSTVQNNDEQQHPLSPNKMQITTLNRYAIKGLGPDTLTSVDISKPHETFPDDRKYALLQTKHKEKFNEKNPEWLHKENFLCAFTEPELMATFRTEYQIMEVDDSEEKEKKTKRMLTLWDRKNEDEKEPLLGPIDLSTQDGKEQLSTYFSKKSGKEVVCVTKKKDNDDNKDSYDDDTQHTHQFGNTRAGVKSIKDTRTIHIINAETVKDVSNKIGIKLNPTRFRPNVIVEGLEPWKEFDFVGKSLVCVPASSSLEEGKGKEKKEMNNNKKGIKINVVSRTVRCAGVGVDPLDPDAGVLDIPDLLSKHFPEHGPFLGVYAVITEGGSISVGDTFELCDSEE